jgi:hypothetical protein
MSGNIVILVILAIVFIGLLAGSIIWTIRLTQQVPNDFFNFHFDESYTAAKTHWWWK